MIIASDLVDINDRNFKAPSGGAIHAAAEFTLVHRIRRGVDADVNGGALFVEFLNGVAFIEAALFPKRAVIPGVFADGEGDTLAFQR